MLLSALYELASDHAPTERERWRLVVDVLWRMIQGLHETMRDALDEKLAAEEELENACCKAYRSREERLETIGRYRKACSRARGALVDLERAIEMADDAAKAWAESPKED